MCAFCLLHRQDGDQRVRPGHANARHPTRAKIKVLDLRHLTFDLNAKEEITRSASGQNRVVFEFEPGWVTLPLQAFWKATIASETFDVRLEVFADSYDASHAKDSGYPSIAVQHSPTIGPAVSAAEHPGRQAGYPDLFSKTIAGQHRSSAHIVYTDKTELTLIHKPEPKPFPPRNTELQAKIDRLIAMAAEDLEQR
jgi:hypothetical protein